MTTEQLALEYEKKHKYAENQYYFSLSIGNPDIALNLSQIKCSEFNETHLNKILSSKDIIRNLLQYEIKYFTPITKSKMNKKEFMNEAISLLNRYQSKGGGFKLEDYKWAIHTRPSLDYVNIQDNEIYFENSMSVYLSNSETEFLDNLVRILNSLADNVRVRMRSYEKDEVLWFVIKCTIN